jgi:hypothetical protein
VTLDADGLIARYCAFYAEPAIPRWGAGPSETSSTCECRRRLSRV